MTTEAFVWTFWLLCGLHALMLLVVLPLPVRIGGREGEPA
jgi:hypothetical protein